MLGNQETEKQNPLQDDQYQGENLPTEKEEFVEHALPLDTLLFWSIVIWISKSVITFVKLCFILLNCKDN